MKRGNVRAVTETEWGRARVLMGRSIRGGFLAAGEMALLERLLRADTKRYERLHAEEKAEAMAEMNPLAGRK